MFVVVVVFLFFIIYLKVLMLASLCNSKGIVDDL